MSVCKRLKELVRTMGTSPFLTGNDSTSTFPRELACVLHESFMAALSEKFSEASHEGQYEVALETSSTLVSLYQLIYPPNYPQIGERCLD